MKLIDIANQIYTDLGEPEATTPEAISSYLQFSAVSKLSTLINENFDIDGDDVYPELSDEQAGIVSQIYYIYFYNKMVNGSLGASGYNWTEVREGDTTIKKTSNNEIAKTYVSQRRDAQALLDDLVYFYKQNKSAPKSYTRNCPKLTSSNCSSGGCDDEDILFEINENGNITPKNA